MLRSFPRLVITSQRPGYYTTGKLLLRDGKKYLVMDVDRLVWSTAWYYSDHRERYVVVLDPGQSKSPLIPVTFWAFDELKERERSCGGRVQVCQRAAPC